MTADMNNLTPPQQRLIDSLLSQPVTPLGKQPTGTRLSMLVMPSGYFYLADYLTGCLVWGNA